MTTVAGPEADTRGLREPLDKVIVLTLVFGSSLLI